MFNLSSSWAQRNVSPSGKTSLCCQTQWSLNIQVKKQEQQLHQWEAGCVLPDFQQTYQTQLFTAPLRTALPLILSLTSLFPCSQPIKLTSHYLLCGYSEVLSLRGITLPVAWWRKLDKAPHCTSWLEMTAWLKLCFPQWPPAFVCLLDDSLSDLLPQMALKCFNRAATCSPAWSNGDINTSLFTVCAQARTHTHTHRVKLTCRWV